MRQKNWYLTIGGVLTACMLAFYPPGQFRAFFASFRSLP